MRVLVVGGQGYIGSSLASELTARGHLVSVAGRRPVHLSKDFGYESIFWDASQEWKFAAPKVDVLVHLASANGSGSLDSLETYLNNIAVTRNVLDLCRRIPGASLLYVSTFQVLGRWSGQLSDRTPSRPLSDYGFCHLAAEEHAKMFARCHDRKLLIVRPTNIVGVSNDPTTIRWDTVPAEFCRQVATQQKVVLHSTGVQQRDFLSIQDSVDRLVSLMEVREFWDSRPRLVGSGKSFAINQVAAMVVASKFRLDSESVIIQKPNDQHSTEGFSEELCIAPSSFRGVTLVGPGKLSLETSIDELILCAKESF